MDSVGLGQSFKESKMGGEKEETFYVSCNPYEEETYCVSCKRKIILINELKAEVDALERRNEELEDELQGIKDNPSVLMEDWSGDLD